MKVNNMKIELNDFESQFLSDMLKSKQLEYKSMKIQTGTIDDILKKLEPVKTDDKKKSYSEQIEDMIRQSDGRYMVMPESKLNLPPELKERLAKEGANIWAENIKNQLDNSYAFYSR